MYCSNCGNSVMNTNGKCQCCGSTNNLTYNLDGIEAAVKAQANSAASMISALVFAQALPLTSLLREWWEKLPVAETEAFTRALSKNIIGIIEKGAFDELIRTRLMSNVLSPEKVSERIKEMLATPEGGLALVDVVAKVIEENFRNHAFTEKLKEGIGDAIREVSRAHTMNHRELIEAAVVAHMPNIEEMTKRIVTDVANDMSNDIRNRMRRDENAK